MASGFDEYAIKLVKSYIEQAQVSFEMADLEEENIQSIRVREELNLARKVQMDLIPTENPITEHFDLSGYSEAAQEVGGDYYDFTYDNDSLDIIIGDVAGSGSAAAFYMVELRGIFQAMIQLNLPMKNLMEVTNQAVSKSLKRTLFTAVTVVEIDFNSMQMRYCRAGHTPILYFDSMQQKAHYFEDKGMGLGIVRDQSFSEHIHIYDRQLQSGDIIVLFTDGITENKNATGELYGQARLLQQLEHTHDHPADTIKNAIIMDCERFGNAAEINDDTTLVVVKIK
jgi:serine phosphatase RsbU (regulator of sigma subunit)